MMGRRAYDVRTATAQMQVVGKRHYGRKALPHGGGGGRQSTRELFDTLLLWRGRVALDANGEASIEIPLNDSLTSFRIVAVASAGLDRFGTGALSIRTTQDLMPLSGLLPVREGDRFRAEFTCATDGGRWRWRSAGPGLPRPRSASDPPVIGRGRLERDGARVDRHAEEAGPIGPLDP
jgi:uncharacterized protein YfaS (alpha-2-macroglobulin family)